VKTSTLSAQDIENTNRSLNFLNSTSNSNSEESISLRNTTSIAEDVKKEKGKEKEDAEKVDEIENTDNENISEVSELYSHYYLANRQVQALPQVPVLITLTVVWRI
jgi:predicted S18 family serine protease